MKTKEQIEEMASDYSTRFITENQFQKQDRIEAYFHGYTQAQQDLINEASEGWKDHFVKHCEGEYENEYHRKCHKAEVENTWIAARLSMMKTPETFDPSISAERYHIWCKHHQKVSEIDSRKIAELEAELLSRREFKKEALEVIGHYGRKDNWDMTDSCYADRFKFGDCEPVYDNEYAAGICGKRARAFLTKHSEEKGEIKMTTTKHLGSLRYDVKKVSCGVKKEGLNWEYSVRPHKVTCVTCIEHLLIRTGLKRTGKTRKWEERLKELKSSDKSILLPNS